MSSNTHGSGKHGTLRILGLACLASVFALAVTVGAFSDEPAVRPPVEVKVKDDKPVVLEGGGGIDPQQHVQVNGQGNMYVNLRVDNRNLHIGVIQTNFHYDGQVLFPGNPPGRMVSQNQALPPGKNKKPRTGFASIYEIGKLVITQEVEVVPTKAKGGQKRRLDAAVVRYFVENKDTQPHKLGVRIFVNPFVGNNRLNLFAAPTQPNKVLDGVELKGKEVPPYLQLLQKPDLKNPGMVAHMTFNFGRAFDMPDRVVLTGQNGFIDQWNLRAVQAMGASALGFYWDPAEIKAGGKRSMAYAFGDGIALSPEGDGQFQVVLGGSFEPGKLFTVAAYVQDPAPGQALSLELPEGMKRIEGKERQPVPEVDEDGNSMVLWKARVLDTGKFTVRIRSSTGVTQTKIITITRPEKTAG